MYIFQVKEKVSKMYDLEKIRFEDIYSGPTPTFAETTSKKNVLNKNKKGQFTLDGWIKVETFCILLKTIIFSSSKIMLVI